MLKPNSRSFDCNSTAGMRETMEHEFEVYALVLHDGVDPKSGGVAIAGFTTAGMVGVIAASHIIKSLKLKQLGTVLNAEFPAVALIHDEIPKLTLLGSTKAKKLVYLHQK